MRHQELIKLINQEIDGVNSAAESGRLQSEIEQNPEARLLMDELKGLVEALASTRSLAPPADLKYAIMREVQQQNLRQFPRVHRLGTWGIARLLRKPVSIFVSGLAAGIALIVIYLNVFPHDYVDLPDATGTMLRAPSSLRTAETVNLAQFGLGGSVETRYGGQVGTLQLRITSAGTGAEFRYDPSEVTMKGVVREDGFDGDVALSEGRIRVEGNHGSFTAFFTARTSTRIPIEVMFFTGGRSLYRGTMTLRPAQEK